MIICSPVKTCVKSIVCLRGSVQGRMNNQFCDATLRSPSTSYCFPVSTGYSMFSYATLSSLMSKYSIAYTEGSKKTCLDISTGTQSVNMKLLMPSQAKGHRMKCNVGPIFWLKCLASVGFFSGLLVCSSYSEPVHAKAFKCKENKEDDCDSSSVTYSHGKEVYTDYSVIGIPGDGRCMFRSVAHGACLRSGKVPPDEKLQRQLADELREKVADEFIKRREETEWFIEGDFDRYVAQMRMPHVWGGEPELLMASHVLRMPITVYMYDQKSCGLISIAEYGEEYGKDDPIRVLYHGYGHYDAVQIPGTEGSRSKL